MGTGAGRYVDVRVCGNSPRIALVFSVKQKAKNKDGKEVLRLRRGEILNGHLGERRNEYTRERRNVSSTFWLTGG